MISLIILLLVFLAIAVLQALRSRIGVWQVMLAGAAAMLACGQISLPDAWRAIDWEIIVFLAGMFLIGESLRQSGLLAAASHRCFYGIKGGRAMLLAFMLAGGLLSAVVTNDTIAVVGTPIALLLAQRFSIKPRLLLLGLAFAVTLGSAFSPLGNPQNLLVALNPALSSPFVQFAWFLALPSLLSLVVAWALLCLLFKNDFGTAVPAALADAPHLHGPMVRSSALSLGLLLGLIVLRVAFNLAGAAIQMPLWLLSAAAALPLLLFGPHRLKLLRGIDWRSLLFFAALFVTVQAFWQQGVLQRYAVATGPALLSPEPLMAVGIVLSQFISNVPLVSLFLPVLGDLHAAPRQYLVLAAGSTIAGNLTILGAASNVIILQQAQRLGRRGDAFGFWDLLKVGAPLTAASALLYLAWWRVA